MQTLQGQSHVRLPALLLPSLPLILLHRCCFQQHRAADHQQQQQVHPGESGEAAFEAKYNCLKNRFRKMEDSYRRELDTLHEEIAVLQDRMKKLDAAR
jgi:signal transduction protein with GAF and PtsI domain